ncbi:MAG: 2-amino-4-hydroxy-6-hydroxymethyldihydropteridine diphosphokinase [Arenicellales bacterium]
MRQVVFSLGSNLEREQHIRFAVCELEKAFGELLVSPVYETVAVGFDGPDFFNLVVVVQSNLSLKRIRSTIQSIEKRAGRIREGKSFASRNLDIDVLLFGQENLRDEGFNVPRDEIDHAAYVLKPLADVLPEGQHPISGERFSVLWQAFKDDAQSLQQVEFELTLCKVSSGNDAT